ncbi:MAG: MarR family winged helix-turn-helix transcriptional regulator [Alphaproteobacteria bacterium]
MGQQPIFDFEAESQPVAQRIGTGLAKIGIAMKSRAWRGAGPERLTPTQGQALTVLRAAVRGLRLDEVASALGVTAPTASDAVAVLVAKGLVSRNRSPDDRRAIALSLTPAGTALADRVAAWPDFLLRALDVLDAAEQTAFLRSLVKIIRGLQEAGDIPIQRMCVSCTYFRPNAHDDRDRPHHCAFVDAPFGDHHLRLDCAEQNPASADQARANWRRWSGADA